MLNKSVFGVLSLLSLKSLSVLKVLVVLKVFQRPQHSPSPATRIEPRSGHALTQSTLFKKRPLQCLNLPTQ